MNILPTEAEMSAFITNWSNQFPDTPIFYVNFQKAQSEDEHDFVRVAPANFLVYDTPFLYDPIDQLPCIFASTAQKLSTTGAIYSFILSIEDCELFIDNRVITDKSITPTANEVVRSQDYDLIGYAFTDNRS